MSAVGVLPADARDRLYARCAEAITAAGPSRESLFLSRLALLLFEELGNEAACVRAIDAALDHLPQPSLSASSDAHDAASTRIRGDATRRPR